MREVFVVSDNILSPLGSTTAENLDRLKKGFSGIQMHDRTDMSPKPFYASLIPDNILHDDKKSLTRFEKAIITSVEDALKQTSLDITGKDTVLIISSTKGNISLLETEDQNNSLKEKISLPHSAELIASHFHFSNQPVIISHACISGLLAIITGMRLIQSGQFENAVITGADMITKFVLSGFQSFQAISPEPCKPFDAKRKGISLGEGAATLILSAEKKYSPSKIKITGGSVSNDANHISGPSRTGEELFLAMNKAMKQANVSKNEIDFISAHGTATLYNDDMEAKAINLADMQSIPVNSLKGYYGHTLGAAGLIESIISIHSLSDNIILPTLGFDKPGTAKPIHVSNKMQTGNYKKVLKTASGFGGCNAAMVMCKDEG
ncbi:MAG: beta-ketoacyl synthase [Bacteroidetes bacterium]|nr:beta-ketoacyl synthase [Bacteroidota bacterium]